MPDTVKVESTTDSAERVAKATGDFKVESNEISTETTKTDKPAASEETREAKTTTAPDAVEAEEIELEETEEETEAREASEKSDEKKPKKRGGFQRRIDQKTREAAEAKREAEFWKAKAMETSKPAGDAKVNQAAKIDLSKKPDPKDFETQVEFIEALTDWKTDQRDQANKAKAREEAVKNEMKTRKDKHSARVNEFAKSHDDFEEAMDSIRTMNAQAIIHEAIMESEHGPAIMYELAKNPKELERINALSSAAAAREIGKLEAKFESSAGTTEAETATKVVEKKVTTAPKPITPVNSKVGHTKTIRDDDLPYEEWVKIRRADLRER